MKARNESVLFTIALCFYFANACGQGKVQFNNYGVNGSAVAHVYGPEPQNPHFQKWGNGAADQPPQTQAYSGPFLAGPNFSVQAWSSMTPVSNVFLLNEAASGVPESLTTFLDGEGAGFFFAPTLDFGNWIFDPDPGIYIQVRAWDNAGGRHATWEQAWNAAMNGGGNAVGWSKVFWQPVTFAPGPAAGLVHFESFNIFIVPEPSAFALVGLGGLMVLFRRAKVKSRK